MFREIFHNVKNIEYLPIITMILFFIIFLYIVIRVLDLDKKFVNYMGNMPLEDSYPNNSINQGE